jgi:hypothetical protein
MTVTMPTISTSVELVTGRRTSPRLPRSPGAAAEELEAVLAHDPLDAADVWAQALPQPALCSFSFTLVVDRTLQNEANWLERATRDWASVPPQNWQAVINLLYSLFDRECTPATAYDEEVLSQVQWTPIRVRPGEMELRSWDNDMTIIFRFRIGRNWAHVVTREGPTVRFVDIEYEGRVEFIRLYASDADDTSDDDSSDDNTSDDDGSEDDRHTGQRNQWASSDEHDADPASDTASDDDWRVDLNQPSLEVSFETGAEPWPVAERLERAALARFWPRLEALSLVEASMHWDTYSSAQRSQVEDMLWSGFNSLLRPRRAGDENVWDIVRWRPLRVDEGRIEANSVCGQHIVFFLFDTERELRQTTVMRVRILYNGPVDFVGAN